MRREIHFPHSLGLLYSAFTYYTGFKVNSGEYKVMGLAPYGEPKLQADDPGQFDRPEGRRHLPPEPDYFDYCTGLRMTNDKFDALFGGPARKPEERLTQRHMDLAASIQAVTEEVVLRLTRGLAKETGVEEPVPGRRRGAELRRQRQGAARRRVREHLGAARGGRRRRRARRGAGGLPPLPGPAAPRERRARRDAGQLPRPGLAQADIERAADERRRQVRRDDAEDHDRRQTAQALADGKAVGWFQGRMEFGPRALGGRSILGDARSPSMQKLLNLKVKYRESFRPFAPSVLREDVAEWFELDGDSPYMLMVADVVKPRRRAMTEEEQKLFGIDKLNVPRSDIPAVTHVDYSARIQTVHAETNPRYHALISAFKQQTGCPVIVNTSFNVRGEPIVCTPEDAFRCFMGSEIETLVVGNCVLDKDQQDPSLKLDYKNAFELD
jgi:carbamoyltransferase